VGTVLTQTHFGNVCVVRLALALVAAGAVLAMNSARRPAAQAIGALAALFVLASLAACGHAAAGSGAQGAIRLTADALHLAAAGAWLGALVPFAALLAATAADPRGLRLVHDAARRFSTLGITSVAVIVFTGIINTRYAVQTLDALTGSRYGIELLVKVAVFLAILTIAAVNRWRLTPRVATTLAGPAALRALRVNTMLEIALGFAIVAIVGNLGITMPPAHH
jgi:putative copper resistance protein D